MKAVSLLIFVSFFIITLAKFVTECGPDGKIVAIMYTPDGDTLPKHKRAPQNGNSDCAQWRAANFPNPGSDYTSLAARGERPTIMEDVVLYAHIPSFVSMANVAVVQKVAHALRRVSFKRVVDLVDQMAV